MRSAYLVIRALVYGPSVTCRTVTDPPNAKWGKVRESLIVILGFHDVRQRRHGPGAGKPCLAGITLCPFIPRST